MTSCERSGVGSSWWRGNLMGALRFSLSVAWSYGRSKMFRAEKGLVQFIMYVHKEATNGIVKCERECCYTDDRMGPYEFLVVVSVEECTCSSRPVVMCEMVSPRSVVEKGTVNHYIDWKLVINFNELYLLGEARCLFSADCLLFTVLFD